MRKVIYYLAASLDGFIAREDGSVDWLKEEDLVEGEDELVEFANTVDTILFGRKTWEKGAELDQEPGASFKTYTNYVFSRKNRPDAYPHARVINESPAEFVGTLKKDGGKNIWLMGGGELAAALLDARLIDELAVNIQPVLLGSGIPMFKSPREFGGLKLTGIRQMKSGSIQVSYELSNGS